jgi:hypothetical protein
MEKISFSTIVQESWRISFSRASFFVFGALMALPFTGQLFIPSYLPEESLKSFLEQHSFFIFLLLISLSVAKLFGKSNLIVSLNTTLKNIGARPRISWRNSWKHFVKAFLIDTILFLFFLVLITILLLPSFFSFAFFGTFPSLLLLFGILILVPVLLISFFIREFSFFYFLLSPVNLRGAFETSATLFMKHRSICLLFGLFALLLGLLFTFCLNLAMLGIVALFHSNPLLSEEGALLGTGLFFLSWYEVFWQAMWLNFFQQLAAPKNEVPEEPTKVGFEEKISEIPSV